MNNATRDYWYGVGYGVLAYFIWGFFPLYWSLLKDVPAGELLAHRIVWSLVFMVGLIVALRKTKQARREIKELLKSRKQIVALGFATIFISGNWYTYIWAVNHDYVIETSLGYYINPLISVLLAVFFLKERLSFWQVISFILAAIGVIIQIVHFGTFPWVALTLALCFGFYGLFKKIVKLSAMLSLTLETLMITPFALMYLYYLHTTIGGAFSLQDWNMNLLLFSSGIATAVPLLLFNAGVRRISLSLTGLLQYIAPTIILIIGVFLFREPFTIAHFFSFLFIWLALAIYTLSNTAFLKQLEAKVTKKDIRKVEM